MNPITFDTMLNTEYVVVKHMSTDQLSERLRHVLDAKEDVRNMLHILNAQSAAISAELRSRGVAQRREREEAQNDEGPPHPTLAISEVLAFDVEELNNADPSIMEHVRE